MRVASLAVNAVKALAVVVVVATAGVFPVVGAVAFLWAVGDTVRLMRQHGGSHQ